MAVLICGASEAIAYKTITHVDTNIGTPNKSSSPGLTSTSTVASLSGLVEGDFLYAHVVGNKAGFSAPDGTWTLIDQTDAPTDLFRYETWWKFADSGDVGSGWTWTDGDTNSPMFAVVTAYRGVDFGSPIQDQQASVAAVSTATRSCPNVTTTTPCIIVSSRAVRLSDSGTAGDSTFTGSGSERIDSGNHSTVGYYMAEYDPNANTNAGSISGISTTRSVGTQTDTIEKTIALRAAVATRVFTGTASQRASQW